MPMVRKRLVKHTPERTPDFSKLAAVLLFWNHRLVRIEIKLLRRDDEPLLANVAAGVFDQTVDMHLTKEFLGDSRHHLAVAVEDGLVVGMASAVHYVHPDKPPQLWINEISVAPTHRGRGLGKALLAGVLGVGRALGCSEAWVLADRPNLAAMRLYAALGGRECPNTQVMFTFPFPRGAGSHLLPGGS